MLKNVFISTFLIAFKLFFIAIIIVLTNYKKAKTKIITIEINTIVF